MASRLSQEEENYVRMCLLMTGISTRAVRIVFDREFAPSCLDSTLRKGGNKLSGLQKQGKINQEQWNLLFMNKPDVPDSKTFDVTLMITLVRHLTKPEDLTPPRYGYDRLPLANETTPTSDLARIKYYRNFLAHLVEEKIEDTKFITAWDIVTDAISRLGGQSMKKECDDLKVKIFDQSNQEIMELNKLIESLKKANEDTVPWNIRAPINDILVEWKENDKMFITTRAAKHVLKCLKENSCVTITASSGVGKTVTLRNVALQMELEGYDVLLVTEPGEIIKFYNPTQKTVFVIDDLCGNYSLNQIDIKVWEPAMQRIKKILSNKLSKMIVACRLQVYQDEKFESLSIFKSCVCNLFSEKMCLSKAEKESIAELYLQTKAHEIADYYDLYDCFPLLCKLYHDNPSPNITDFFKYPFQVYEAEIDKLQKKGFYSKYCALALIVVFNNNLHEEILTEDIDEETKAIIENTCEACRLERGTSRLTLQDDLNSFIHTFLKKEQNMYKTIHDKIFDFLAYYFGQKIVRCLIQNAHSGLVIKRFLLERQENMNQFITIVHPKYHQMYTKRLIKDWSKGEVNDVFCNINMKIPQFRIFFLYCLNELDTSYQRQLAHTCDVYNNDTALLMSCFEGDIPMIHWCLNHDVDVNQCRNDMTTPLLVAAGKGFTEIVQILLNMGADYNKCDNGGFSSLMISCGNGHTKIISMLLEKGADYNKCDKEGASSLMSACEKGHTAIVKMLLEKGADYNKCDNDGFSPLMRSCGNGHTEIIRMLLEKGTDYDKCDKEGFSPLMRACDKGDIEIVLMLLEKGADYNKCDFEGFSPLMRACAFGHTAIVRMLLKRGADVDKCDDRGVSTLMRACSSGQTEMVKMLLAHGADYNKCDNDGLPLLVRACSIRHTEIISILLEKGADYNKCDNEGFSPLMRACGEGHSEIVMILLEKGADYNNCDYEGISPLMRACEFGHTAIVRMLLEKGADQDKCDDQGVSPLMRACNSGHTELVRMLLEIGVDYNKCDNVGFSPLMRACGNKHSEIIRILLEKGAN